MTDSLLAKSDEDPKTAQYNFDAYMLTGAPQQDSSSGSTVRI